MKAFYIAIVLFSALLIGFVSVLGEAIMSFFNLGPFIVTGLSAIFGGGVMLAITFLKYPKIYREINKNGIFKIIISSIFGAIGLLLWFDSITRIGASKELLLGGNSSEMLLVLILSFVFLGERLKRFEIVGGFLIIVGIFVVLFNPVILQPVFGLGELEAMISSLAFAINIVISTNILRKLSDKSVSILVMMLEGLFILGAMFIANIQFQLTLESVFWIFLLGIFGVTSILTYFYGLKKIGASLTVIIASFAGVFSIGLQLIAKFLFPSIELIFPQSIVLAVIGGVIAVGGVFLISYKEK
ncbi:MAG TPA: DMT family transporter [archaeon]|nr:DMT family transporter [archaeon]